VSVVRKKLVITRWALIALTFGLVTANWVYDPKGNAALLWFFLIALTMIPAAMLSLHLHPPKFLKHLERR
jgi:hypothetical protein